MAPAARRAARRRGAEDAVPERRRDAVGRAVVLEVVAHVVLAQPAPQSPARPGVVDVEVGEVVGQVAREEARAEAQRGARGQHEVEREHEDRAQRQRGGRRHHEPQGVVRMVVVDAVEHPVQPGPDAALGCVVEDDAVQPVLRQRPGQIARKRRRDRHRCRQQPKRPDQLHEDHRHVQRRDDGDVDAGEAIQHRGGEHRRGGPQTRGAVGRGAQVIGCFDGHLANLPSASNRSAGSPAAVAPRLAA